MSVTICRNSLFLASLCLLIPQARMQGASISWGAATTISGDSNVSTNGTKVFAYNVGGVATTVNGVAFDPFTFSSAATVTIGSVQLSSSASLSTEATGGSGPPFTTLSAAYQALLDHGLYAPSAVTMTISNLLLGSQYEFQVWISNLQTVANGSIRIDDGAGHTVRLATGPTAGLGQFVIGTFTADATTQTIGFTDLAGLHDIPVNGFQLRLNSTSVPEPSSYLLTALGVLGLIGVRWRR